MGNTPSKDGAHPHPCHFRPDRWRDRGWGEAAFHYVWSSTSGANAESSELPDLAHCSLYEIAAYDHNEGRYENGLYFPPSPPFAGWQFRNPTDGRLQIVGGEWMSATLGEAWDRHKIGGPLALPSEPRPYEFTAWQQFWFHCKWCKAEFPLSEPHPILRRMEPLPRDSEQKKGPDHRGERWRYSLTKHQNTAWMEWDAEGYSDCSLHVGFPPVFG